MAMLTLIPKPLTRLYWKYRLLQWHLMRQFCETVTLHTRQGVFTLPLHSNDAISKHLYARGEFELELIHKSLDFLRREGKCPPRGQGTVLDIGANNGVISIGMLASGEMQRAIAVEPDPVNFFNLQRNVKANQFESRFVCVQRAAADERSELEFELCDDNFGDHRVRKGLHNAQSAEQFGESRRKVIKVQADTIDRLLEDIGQAFRADIALVWVDVQGYEGYVFRGAQDLLSQDIPVMTEVWPYGIERTGMSLAEFCEITRQIWTTFWVQRRGRFVARPIGEFSAFLREIGSRGKFKNAVFTK